MTAVDQAGLEPARRGLQDRCSAAELLIVAYPRRDSHSGCQVRSLVVSPLACEGMAAMTVSIPLPLP